MKKRMKERKIPVRCAKECEIEGRMEIEESVARTEREPKRKKWQLIAETSEELA